MNYEFDLTANAINSSPPDFPTSLRVWTVFDYAGDGLDNAVFDGTDLVIEDTVPLNFESDLKIFENPLTSSSNGSGETSSSGVTDLLTSSFGTNSFDAGFFETTGGDLVAGHTAIFQLPNTDGEEFEISLSGTVAAVGVPEPSSLISLAGFGLLLILRRQSREELVA